jgi:hypothetical protein
VITGIPDYKSPVEQSLRCLCGLRYVVYLGAGIGLAGDRARERAELLRARYVNATVTPWLACECGQVLDFVSEVSLTVQ